MMSQAGLSQTQPSLCSQSSPDEETATSPASHAVNIGGLTVMASASETSLSLRDEHPDEEDRSAYEIAAGPDSVHEGSSGNFDSSGEGSSDQGSIDNTCQNDAETRELRSPSCAVTSATELTTATETAAMQVEATEEQRWQ